MRHVLFGLWLASCLAAGCGARPSPATPVHVSDENEQAREHFEHGVAFANAGDFTRAEQYLALALQEGHEVDRTLKALLSVCVRASRLRSALAYALPQLSAHPTEWPLRQFVASVHLALADRDAAQRELSRVIAQEPRAAEAHFLLAIVFTQTDPSSERAREHFARYLALSPRGVHADEAHAALSLAPRDG